MRSVASAARFIRLPTSANVPSHPALIDLANVDDPVFQNDLIEFGAEAAVALHQLPAALATLNRGYLKNVQRRSLRTLPELRDWCGRQAAVFLRHDSVYVFAIACDDLFGMANHIELTDAVLSVSPQGRQQTLDRGGPLPNRSAVHAFINGTLTNINDESGSADLRGWTPIVYRPAAAGSFLSAITSEPVTRAARVLMIPGKIKVWGQGLSEPSDKIHASVTESDRELQQ